MNPLLQTLLATPDFSAVKACYADSLAYQSHIHEIESKTPEPELLLSVLGN